jgi:hypothetical protein
MQRLFVFVKLISVLAFISSCAYERDPGLRQDPRPKPQVNDVLVGKANYEILDYKYQNLALNCEIVSEVVNPNDTESSMSTLPEATVETPAPNPPATEPVVNNGNKTKFDLLAQMSVDPKLEKEQTNAKMEVDEETRKLTLKLKIKPVLFIQSLNLKVESTVYIMKHTPTLKLAYTYTTSSQNRDTSVEGQFEAPVNEGVPFKGLFSTETLDGKTTQYYAKCDLKGQVKSDKDDLATQWLRIDCSKPAEQGKEALHAANCRAGMPIPDNI